ncbi:MAG TPA: hypothetical protein VLR71_13970 [Casimicrobiaceae bacterium]|nr:hypothetical protein [Casimicrobiaceae bacterium]
MRRQAIGMAARMRAASMPSRKRSNVVHASMQHHVRVHEVVDGAACGRTQDAFRLNLRHVDDRPQRFGEDEGG